MTLNKLFEILKGGPGSGFRDHAGVPGSRGGSAPRGSSASRKKVDKKITIQKAARMLSEGGYKLGRGHTDLETKTTSYEVTNPSGKTKKMTTDEIRELVSRI